MKMSLLVLAVLFGGVSAQAAGPKYLVQSGYWTGDDRLSSSPSPHCACDINRDVIDCSPSEQTLEAAGYMCYDEFIPEGSQGWVHAEVHTVKQF